MVTRCVPFTLVNPSDTETEPRTVTNYKRLIEITKLSKPFFVYNDTSSCEGLENMASEISKVFTGLHDNSLKTLKANRRSGQAILVAKLNAAGHDVISKANAAKHFYEFGAAVKSGFKFQEDDFSDTPSIDKLGITLVNKLNELYVADPNEVSRIIDKLFDLEYDKKGVWPSNEAQFTQVILSTSDSGARDYMNLSLKVTKTIIRNNHAIRRQLLKICEGCVRAGYFPKIWCKDQISFLFKNKEERSDPAMYRPITIAPSLGKHLEKVISSYLGDMNDRNDHNHAYIKRRSCLSAIVDVRSKIMEATLLAHQFLAPGFKAITFISADDIAAAFESIEHFIICETVRRSFIGDTGFNVSGSIEIYLKQRVSIAIDKVKKTEFVISRRYGFKTSPQGSILSPKFWRIFDAIFTELYLERLNLLKRDHSHIKLMNHTSYADDHLTILTIAVREEEHEHLVAEKIKCLLEATRKELLYATTKIGCSIQPTKSEIIVTQVDARMINRFYPTFEVKSDFKWLGFRLKMQESELIFCEKGVVKRLNSALNMCRHIFQISSGIFLRWKTFKTYVTPFLEPFLPFQIQQGIDKASELTKAQHKCLSQIVGLTPRNNSRRLREVLAELSIKGKAIRLSKRFESETSGIGDMMNRVLELEANKETAGGRIRTRSGNELTSTSAIVKTIVNSFIYKLRQASRWPTEEKMFRKTQFKMAKIYAKSWKARIRRKIIQRSKQTPTRKKRKRKRTDNVTEASRRRRNVGLNN